MKSKVFREIKCQMSKSKNEKMNDLEENRNKQVNSTGHWDKTQCCKGRKSLREKEKSSIYAYDSVPRRQIKNTNTNRKLKLLGKGITNRNAWNKNYKTFNKNTGKWLQQNWPSKRQSIRHEECDFLTIAVKY